MTERKTLGTMLPRVEGQVPAATIDAMPWIPSIYFDESLERWFACAIAGCDSREEAQEVLAAMGLAGALARLAPAA